MFEHIDELPFTALMATFVVVAMVIVIQYSRYIEHRKAHAADPKDSDTYRLATKFAAVPYLIVPALFAELAILSALVAVDILVARGTVSGIEIPYAAVALSVVIYLAMDKVVIRQCGNQVYFDTIEDKLFQSDSTGIQEVNMDPNQIISIPVSDLKKLINKKRR